MPFSTCPAVACSADLKADLMTSFQVVDLTNVIDRTCNGALFLTDDAGLNIVGTPASGGWLTDAARVQIITSLSQVAAHYAKGSQTYIAAKAFFDNAGTRGVATYFMLGLWDRANAESAVSALDAINACQPCWTHLAMVHATTDGDTLIDDPLVDSVAEWAVVNEKIPYLLTTDPDTTNPSDTANLKARLYLAGIHDVVVTYSAGQCQTVTDPVTGAVQYFAIGAPITDANGAPVIDPDTDVQAISDGTTPMSEIVHPYIDLLQAGWVANVDLTQRDSGYTLAYKPVGGSGFIGIEAAPLDNGIVAAVTGILPDGTINQFNNGHANVYVRTAGRVGLFAGITVGGSWADQVHLKLFLKRRLRDELAQLFFSERRVPYDDARGAAKLAATVSRVMTAAQSAGHFTGDAVNWEAFGAYRAKGIGWVVRQDSFAAQTTGRKNARLAPQLAVCFIPAGATNHVPVQICTLAVQNAA